MIKATLLFFVFLIHLPLALTEGNHTDTNVEQSRSVHGEVTNQLPEQIRNADLCVPSFKVISSGGVNSFPVTSDTLDYKSLELCHNPSMSPSFGRMFPGPCLIICRSQWTVPSAGSSLTIRPSSIQRTS